MENILSTCNVWKLPFIRGELSKDGLFWGKDCSVQKVQENYDCLVVSRTPRKTTIFTQHFIAQILSGHNWFWWVGNIIAVGVGVGVYQGFPLSLAWPILTIFPFQVCLRITLLGFYYAHIASCKYNTWYGSYFRKTFYWLSLSKKRSKKWMLANPAEVYVIADMLFPHSISNEPCKQMCCQAGEFQVDGN